VLWCGDDGKLQEADCNALGEGKTCQLKPDGSKFACLGKGTPCPAGLDWYGKCEGNNVLWCADNELRSWTCGAEQECKYENAEVGHSCVAKSIFGGGGGAASSNGSCVGHCTQTGPVAGSYPLCYCDPDCVAKGDCCPDYLEGVCEGADQTTGSCSNFCGQVGRAPGASSASPCYCDDFCSSQSPPDCCPDYATYCSAPSYNTTTTCAGKCNDVDNWYWDGASWCGCDASCVSRGDCCGGTLDYSAQCAVWEDW
jgi:hypothetical protein